MVGIRKKLHSQPRNEEATQIEKKIIEKTGRKKSHEPARGVTVRRRKSYWRRVTVRVALVSGGDDWALHAGKFRS